MTKPLTDCEMDRLMAALGPFEDKPHIVVAVSGGADSMALSMLANDWARRHGGKLTALTVDHGLRPGSGEETRQVKRWLNGHGIDHQVLHWVGAKPRSAIQARARDARYGLLADWCRKAAVLHLLLAHHQQDQAETVLLRLNHDSGLDGLAGMSAIVEKPAMRLLRPLLGIARSRLQATLKARSQPWLEDPSNENMAFERIRIRKSLAGLADLGITAPGLAQAGARMARVRTALEATASDLLAVCCSLHPAGYATMDAPALFSGPDEISLRALARTLLCVGGGGYAPALAKQERLHEKMKAAFRDNLYGWKGATLGRCRVLALEGAKGVGQFLICREQRFLPPPVAAAGALEMFWDDRFQIRLGGQKGVLYQSISLQALGLQGSRKLLEQAPELRSLAMPRAVTTTLPALVDDDVIVAVPQLDYRRHALATEGLEFSRAVFHPRQTLSATGFLVAH